MHLALERIEFVIEAVRLVESVFAEYGIVATETDFGCTPYAKEDVQAGHFPVADIAHGHAVEHDGRELRWNTMLGEIDRERIDDPMFGTYFTCVALRLGPEDHDPDVELYFTWDKRGRRAEILVAGCMRDSELQRALLDQYGTRPLSKSEQREVLHRFARAFLAPEDRAPGAIAVKSDGPFSSAFSRILEEDEELRTALRGAVDVFCDQTGLERPATAATMRFVRSYLPFRRVLRDAVVRLFANHPEYLQALLKDFSAPERSDPK